MTLSKGILAAVGLLLGATCASAGTVAPGDVVFKDTEVVVSLTGAPGDPEKGKVVFSDRKLGNCLACHTNKDMASQLFHGDVGPVLDGVAGRRTPEEIRAILVNSKEVFGPETPMPAFYKIIEGKRVAADFEGKTILTADQVEDVVAYLSTLKE